MAARLRRSGIGRSLLAVRDNELAAAAMGLSPTRAKLLAFGVSGALAGLAGGCLVGLLVQFTPDRFQATESLTGRGHRRRSAGCPRSRAPSSAAW